MTMAINLDVSGEELAMRLLGAYDAADGMEEWSTLVGLDHHDPAAEEAFTEVHEMYAAMWRQLGDDFHRRLSPYVEAWEAVRASGRTGKRNWLTRAWARLA